MAKVTTQLPAGGGQLVKGQGVLSGWNMAESGGAATVQVRLFDAVAAPTLGVDPLLVTVRLSAGQSAGDEFTRIYKQGVWALVSGSGTVEGVVDC